MKKSVRVALILIALGLCILLIALCFSRFDFFRLMTKELETETVTVEEPFDRIVVESDARDVIVIPAADGVCRVTGPVDENIRFSADVADGELRVSSKEERHFDLYISTAIIVNDSIRIELPQAEYAALEITCASGNVSVDPGFDFARLEIASASGNIDSRADAEALEITTASGNISVSDAALGTVSVESASGRISADDLHAETFSAVSSSGDLKLSEIRCDDLRIKTASGSAKLSDVIAANLLQAETASGSIRLESCDADSLNLTTRSGGIRGTLLSPKRFEIADVGSGRISVPSDTDGGLCTLKTGSGDIRIEISE